MKLFCFQLYPDPSKSQVAELINGAWRVTIKDLQSFWKWHNDFLERAHFLGYVDHGEFRLEYYAAPEGL